MLKVFGRQDDLISFLMEGYTWRWISPCARACSPFLDELDALVLEYGGRLYLSKDARMQQEVFWKSYPNARKFESIVQAYNPGGKFRSVQSDRLQFNYGNS